MANNKRKKHDHPRLIPPVGDINDKKNYKQNDEGKVIAGRVYTYHPTKGWRSRRFNTVEA